MPYVDEDKREEIDRGMGSLNAGELNYEITHTILRYWNAGPQRYQRLNDIIGALEGAKAEFQRRVVAPYEDRKITENGDVY